jgi:anti-sigma B factor antagonist
MTLSGELDLYSARELEAAVLALSDRWPSAQVVLDVGEVTFVDSTGLGVIVRGMRRFRAHGGDVALRGPSHQTMRVLELTGLTEVFEILDGPRPT